MKRGAVERGMDAGPAALSGADLGLLAHPTQIALMRRMAEWPRLVEQAAGAQEPHRVAFFLYDLAAEFHAHYNLAREEPALRVLQDGDEAGNRARLALMDAVSVVIATGLGILGVTPAEDM
jgi:arginyl-tRNA synthetase